jgi:(2Fe-2S) ferredoxin
MPSCGPNGGDDVLAAFLDCRARAGLVRSVFVTETMCLGVCPVHGSAVVIYPEGVWYGGVTAADVPRIVAEHLVGGRPVAELLDPRFR